MLGTYLVVVVLGLLAVSLVGWSIAGELSERRKARAAAEVLARFQRIDRDWKTS